MGDVTRPSRRLLLGSAAAVAIGGLPLPAAADDGPPPLSLYGKLPRIAKAAISPDGKRVAVVRNEAGALKLDDIELATGKTATIDIDANAVPTLIWADNDSVLVVLSRTSRLATARYEAWNGVVVNVRTGKRYQLYSNLGEFGSNLLGDFQRIRVGERYRVTASNVDAGAANYVIDYSTALYAFGSDNFRAYHIDDDTRRVINWALLGDGTPLARAEYDEDRRVWKLRYLGPRGWRVIYSVKADLDLPILKGPGRDGRSVLLLMKAGDHPGTYAEVDENGVFGEPLASNPGKVFPVFSPVTGRLVGFNHDDGLEHAIYYDPAYARLPALVRQMTDAPCTELVDINEAGDHILLYSEGPGNPGRHEAIDFTTGARVRIGDSYPDLPPAWVFAKEAISYTAGDGLTIPAFLTRPKNATGPLPLIVMPHGGPEYFDDTRFDWMAQALASRGYLVLQANYRGSSGFGTEFTTRGYGEFGRKMQSDLSDGVQHLVAQGLADPGRVAICGASYGGYAALAGVTLQSGIYRCAVCISGYGDVEAYMDDIMSSAKFNARSRTVLYWQRYIGEGDYTAISPIRHITATTAPVLLIHGRDDTVVSVEQSFAMRDALKRAGRPVESILLTNGDHYLSQEDTRIAALESLTAFLIRYNPPV